MVQLSTPCIKICIIDPPSGLCQGCFRSLDEIARWTSFSEDERQSVMHELSGRRTASRAARLAAAGRTNPRRARFPTLREG